MPVALSSLVAKTLMKHESKVCARSSCALHRHHHHHHIISWQLCVYWKPFFRHYTALHCTALHGICSSSNHTNRIPFIVPSPCSVSKRMRGEWSDGKQHKSHPPPPHPPHPALSLHHYLRSIPASQAGKRHGDGGAVVTANADAGIVGSSEEDTSDGLVSVWAYS